MPFPGEDTQSPSAAGSSADSPEGSEVDAFAELTKISDATLVAPTSKDVEDAHAAGVMAVGAMLLTWSLEEAMSSMINGFSSFLGQLGQGIGMNPSRLQADRDGLAEQLAVAEEGRKQDYGRLCSIVTEMSQRADERWAQLAGSQPTGSLEGDDAFTTTIRILRELQTTIPGSQATLEALKEEEQRGVQAYLRADAEVKRLRVIGDSLEYDDESVEGKSAIWVRRQQAWQTEWTQLSNALPTLKDEISKTAAVFKAKFDELEGNPSSSR
jgi:hypothetical protein